LQGTATFLTIKRMRPIARALYLEALAIRWLRRRGFLTEEEEESRPILDGRTTGLGKGLSPFAGAFSKFYDNRALGHALSRAQVMQGWRLAKLSANNFMDANAEAARTHQRRLVASGLTPADLMSALHNPSKGRGLLRRSSSKKARNPSSTRGCCSSKQDAAVPAPSPSSEVADEAEEEVSEDFYGEDEEESGDYDEEEEEEEGDSAASALATGGPAHNEAVSTAAIPAAVYPTSQVIGDTEWLGGDVWLLRKFDRAPEMTIREKDTWQVVSELGLRSYDYLSNPVYVAALAAARESAAAE